MRKCSCLNPAGGGDLCGSLGWFCMLKTKISYKWTSYESKICILILLLKSDKIQSDGFFFFSITESDAWEHEIVWQYLQQ